MWPAVLWWRFLNFLLRASRVWTLQSKGLQSYRPRTCCVLLKEDCLDVSLNYPHPSKSTGGMLNQDKRRMWAVNVPSLWYGHANVL